LWSVLNSPPIEYWLKGSADIVHAVALGYPVATRKPLVVTVHDLGPLTHPEFFSNTHPWIMKLSLAQAVKQANALICVSTSTATELSDYVGPAVLDRVHVIPEGVSSFFFEPPDVDSLRFLADLPDPGTPFILSTGKLSPRKNVQGLLDAMALLSAWIPHHLVLVGGEGWGVEEMISTRDRAQVHFVGYVTDEQLRALYGRASVYVHPSLYEGFGLTVLEAMAAGCPVVTSNVYSLPEVAGDAALLVDPRDTEALADAIRRLCTDDELAADLRARGKRRAESYRWDSCASQVVSVYHEVSSRPAS